MVTTLIKYENSTTISFNPINLSYNKCYQEFKAQTDKYNNDFTVTLKQKIMCSTKDIQGKELKTGYYYPYVLFTDSGMFYKIILVPSNSRPLFSLHYSKINHLLYIKQNKTISPFPSIKLVDNKPYNETTQSSDKLKDSIKTLSKDTSYAKSNPNVTEDNNSTELAMTNKENIFVKKNIFSDTIEIGGIKIDGVAIGKKNNTKLTTQGYVDDSVKKHVKQKIDSYTPTGHSQSHLSHYIQFFTNPTEFLPKGYAISEDGTEIATGANGYSGIAPYNIKTTQESLVLRGYELGYVYCAEDIPLHTEVTFEASGKAIAYAGAGIKTGLTLMEGEIDKLCKIYTYPSNLGSDEGTDNRTYIITGGNSSDSLDDELVDYIALTQYKIEGSSYEYPGGTDVAGAGVSETNYKVWLGNDNDVHFGAIAPDESIIIATYDTDATGTITRYEPLEQFAILSTVNRLVEGKNEILTTTGSISTAPSGSDLEVTWSADIRIELPSTSSGTADYNNITAGSIILADTEIAYVTLERDTNAATLTVNKTDSASADLTENNIILFFNKNTEIYSPHFDLFINNIAYIDKANTFTEDQTIDANLTVSGNFTVNGTTTTIDTTTLEVEDKNIEMGVVDTPTDITADGGGLTLKGDTDKTIIWDNTNDNWTSSEHWNLVSGKEYKINNISINTGGTLDNVAYLDQANTFTENQTAPNFIGDLTGNADTATALETARNIAGQSFDGTGDITIASTDLTDTANIPYLDTANVFGEIQSYSGTPSFTNDNEIINKKYVDDTTDSINFDGLPDTQSFTTANSIYKVSNSADSVQESLATIDDTGNINIPSGQSYNIAGSDINTGGTLSNIAYLDTANVFTALQTITIADSVNTNALILNQNDITNNPKALVINNTGTGNSIEVNTTDFVVDNNSNTIIGGNLAVNGTTTPLSTLHLGNDYYSSASLSTDHTSIILGQGGMILANKVDVDINTVSGLYYDGTDWRYAKNNSNGSMWLIDGGVISKRIGGSTSHSAGDVATLTTQFEIDANGTVITTTSETIGHTWRNPSTFSNQELNIEWDLYGGDVSLTHYDGSTRKLLIGYATAYPSHPFLLFGGDVTHDSSNGTYFVKKVGIGTNEPARPLHIQGSATESAELLIDDSESPTDQKRFNVYVSSGVTYFRALNDAGDSGINWLAANNSTGVVTFSGDIFSNGKIRISTTSTSEESVAAFTGTNTTRSRVISNNNAGADSSFSLQKSGTTRWSLNNRASDNAFTLTENLDADTSVVLSIGTSTGNAWFVNDVSALSFTDRTPYPKDLQTAIDSVMSMERLPDSKYKENNREQQLDHSKLHPYLRGQGKEPNRDMSATISAQNEVIKYLLKEVDKLKEKLTTQ